MDLAKYISAARLNARLAGLVLTNRTFRHSDLAQGYDYVSNTYDAELLYALKPVTDQLLKILPQFPPGEIYDLGCGTGYTTIALARRFPECRINGVDVSLGMLTKAAQNCHCAFFHHADNLSFLSEQAAESAGGIVAAWSLGSSSDLPDVFAECRRVVRKKGSFAFIINLADSMAPVSNAFIKCMHRFPGKVSKALLPQYPKNWSVLENLLEKNSMKTVWLEDGTIDIKPRDPMRPLNWLLKTGVLAGIEAVLPLRTDKEIAEYFEQELLVSELPLQHHFIAAIAQPA
ncbi:MAG: class I SAM-dependent DNA methyltransferase [Victivallaceae bacterium]